MMSRLCCMRLNTAGVVIGWIGSVFSLIYSILIILGLSRVDDLAKAIYGHLNEKDMTEDNLRKGLIVVFSIYLTINVINLVASALLVAGTIKERHLMIVPWLINSGLSLCFNFVYLLYIVVMGISVKAPVGSILVSILFAAVGLVIQYVIWYAIYSLFKTLQQRREQRQQLLPTTGSSYPSYTKI